MDEPQRRPVEVPPPASKIAPRLLDKPWALAVAFLTVGPLALPWVWKSARYSRRTKWILTVAILAFTVWLTIGATQLTQAWMQQLEEMMGQ